MYVGVIIEILIYYRAASSPRSSVLHVLHVIDYTLYVICYDYIYIYIYIYTYIYIYMTSSIIHFFSDYLLLAKPLTLNPKP